MATAAEEDNNYQVDATITAKDDLGLSLVIVKYYQRIYYCAVAGESERKQLGHFERELIPLS